MRIWIAFFSFLTTVAVAETALPVAFQEIQAESDAVYQAVVQVLMDGKMADTSWQLTTVQQQVFIGRLVQEAPLRHPDDVLFQAQKQPNPAYHGLRVTLTTYDGEKLPEINIFNGQVTDAHGRLLRADAGRELELWVFGTAKLLKQQFLATQVIPIFSFNQCLLLGNLIIETKPRQCLLPDNNLLLDVPERPTVDDLKVQDFDTCLKKGKALIDVFPRRCLAAGGRVFTEPPRLIEVDTPADTSEPVDIDEFLREYRQENEF